MTANARKMETNSFFIAASSICLTLLITSTCSVRAYESTTPKPVTGIEGKTVTLLCTVRPPPPSPSSGAVFVEWADLVYNSNPFPQRIFSSANNAQFSIDSSHPNAANYKVDASTYTLTIRDLKRTDDPGRYMCQTVTANGTTIAHNDYYLSVATVPTCYGNTEPKLGEDTILECNMTFSGGQPDLEWSHNNKRIDSEDHFDVGVAKKRIALVASHTHDKAKYTCNVSFGNMEESCSLTLNITYAVRDLKIETGEPHHKMHAGDDVTCSAKGNPTPVVTMEPYKEGGANSGPGWRSFRVSKDWVGKNISFYCTATNTHEGKTRTLEKNSTFHVLSADLKPTTTTTTTTRAPDVAGDQQVNNGHHHNKDHRKDANKPNGRRRSEGCDITRQLCRSSQSP